MFQPELCVVYSHTPAGRRALAFAAGLLPPESQICVLLQNTPVKLPEPGATTEDYCETQRLRVAREVSELTGLDRKRITVLIWGQDDPRNWSPHHIVIGDRLLDELAPASLLLPFAEEGLTARGNGPVVIPFGNGESGACAASKAIPLARFFNLAIAFYHTTWKNPQVETDDATLHMCGEALELQRSLESKAGDAGVSFTTTIETADDVVEGILRFSLRIGARLVAMSRGLHTGHAGSYVTQMAAQSPVPLFIAGRENMGRCS